MSEWRAKLDERDRELEVYLRFLSQLDDKSATLSIRSGDIRRTRHIDEQVLKILKANFFLLMYNLVEASIRDGFRMLYTQIQKEGCTVRSIKEELRLLWVDAAIDRIEPQSATQLSYRDLTRRLVKNAVDDVGARLNVEDLRFRGNLDAERIRRACLNHGVSSKTHPRAKGGDKLGLVKSRRNALAHGTLSFTECGRDYTLAQLVEIRRETVVFVRGILRNIERYASRRAFRSA